MSIRLCVQIIDKNSGWIFTSTAAKVFSGIETLCSVKDAKGNPSIVGMLLKIVVASPNAYANLAPAKWNALKSVLAEFTLSKDCDDSGVSGTLEPLDSEQTHP